MAPGGTTNWAQGSTLKTRLGGQSIFFPSKRWGKKWGRVCGLMKDVDCSGGGTPVYCWNVGRKGGGLSGDVGGGGIDGHLTGTS